MDAPSGCPPASAARPPAAWAERLRPLGQRYVIELLKPAEQSSGGIWIPERFQDNWTHGIVRGVGPGEMWESDGLPQRSFSWLEVGDEAMFPKHAFQSLGAPHTHGLVRDEDLVATIAPAMDRWADGALQPLNDWVMIDQDPEYTDATSSIVYAEEWRPRPTHGRVLDYGPGKVRWKGPLYGVRYPVPWEIGDPRASKELIGKRVWWSKECEVMSLGRERLEAVFIQAFDLLFVQDD